MGSGAEALGGSGTLSWEHSQDERLPAAVSAWCGVGSVRFRKTLGEGEF